ncbi:DedA family protein [Salinispora sp. H7-4]|uniref:DedA family protein n=1 Tax=Salinispora sp. H7-4 TaxID=2748321 RepID=UPI0015D36483|nr:DedA family protein [Salinispora sp. H7-4]NYT94600.1 DedA family protein [Salinispora sp. H7-4]
MTDWLAGNVMTLGLWGTLLVVLLLPALEAAIPFIGILVPGQSAVVVGGMLASHRVVPLPATIAAALVGAVLGNLIGYWVGERWMTAAYTTARGDGLRHRHTAKALELVEGRGSSAVLIGRFVPGMRTLVPTLCGMVRTPWRAYLTWSVTASVVWAVTWTLIGVLVARGAGGVTGLVT